MAKIHLDEDYQKTKRYQESLAAFEKRNFRMGLKLKDQNFNDTPKLKTPKAPRPPSA